MLLDFKGTLQSSDDLQDSPFFTCSICPDNKDTSAPVILPCAHAFHSGCIIPWIDIKKCQQQRCPYCRSSLHYPDCGHSFARGYYHPGADLRSPSSKRTWCSTCWLLEQLQFLIVVAARIWWALRFAYPEEVEYEPPNNQSLPSRYSSRRGVRIDCISLQAWMHETDSPIEEAWMELKVHQDDSIYGKSGWPFWERIPAVLQDQLDAMFPWEEPADEQDPRSSSTVRVSIMEPRESLRFSGQIVSLNLLLERLLHPLDWAGAVRSEINSLNRQYRLREAIGVPWSI
ncbi:hypothetical protein F4804DRAFT_337635 [Jackrogersella minutella]|nr:hypothetical protein F4804DRAFT_337635 [Jackrogersella minutella]